MRSLTNTIEQFALVKNDTNEIRQSKKLILIISLSCSLCGMIWGGIYYLFLGINTISILPGLFVLVVGSAIFSAHKLKKHLILVYAQLTCITWIPTLIQWHIGSIHNSGIVIIWSFLGPIGALLFLNKRQALFWMFQFLIIVAISVALEPQFSSDISGITDTFRNIFYTMNLCVPFIVVFGASFHFVTDIIKQKDLNLSLLKITESKNKEILDSISYAKRIQSAIMPSESKIKLLIPEGFVLYKPKDIVSGDFYWINRHENNLFIAACDCTGHGVPGALVSVICNSALNRSLNEYRLKKPGEILSKTRELILTEFEKSEGQVNDGMDVALVQIDGNILSFSGANNPLWIIRQGTSTIEEIKGCKQSVGYTNNSTPFLTHETEVNSGDCVYIFTDGYPDQFGGPDGKKFKIRAFKELLKSIYQQPFDKQKIILDNTIEDWRGTLEQVDDICVIGFKIK